MGREWDKTTTLKGVNNELIRPTTNRFYLLWLNEKYFPKG
jgi:hypothetical protein